MPRDQVSVLVIHGIGDQKPYQTLDQFCVRLTSYLQSQPDNRSNQEIRLCHYRRHTGGCQFDDGVRIEEADGFQWNIQEYYWSNLVRTRVSFAEIIHWLIETSDGAADYYSENSELVKEYESFENGKFKKRWYLKHLGWFTRLVFSLPLSIRPLPQAFDRIITLFLGEKRRLFIKHISDVVMYTSADNSSHYDQIRSEVLHGAVEKIKELLKEDAQVVIVGHSLGSVIAYDAMNKINHLMNHDPGLKQLSYRLKGIISIGSPLDKVGFFFRERARRDQYVRRYMIKNIHGFRTRGKVYPLNGVPVTLTTEVRDHLSHVRWINLWNSSDPISGHLDFYRDVENIELKDDRGWVHSHVMYWDHSLLYRAIQHIVSGENFNTLWRDERGEDQTGGM